MLKNIWTRANHAYSERFDLGKEANSSPFPFYIYSRLFVSRTDFHGYCTMIESIIEIQKETPQDIPISGASSRSYGIACLHVYLRISTRWRRRCYLGWITYVYSHAFSYLVPLKDAILCIRIQTNMSHFIPIKLNLLRRYLSPNCTKYIMYISFFYLIYLYVNTSRFSFILVFYHTIRISDI